MRDSEREKWKLFLWLLLLLLLSRRDELPALQTQGTTTADRSWSSKPAVGTSLHRINKCTKLSKTTAQMHACERRVKPKPGAVKSVKGFGSGLLFFSVSSTRCLVLFRLFSLHVHRPMPMPTRLDHWLRCSNPCHGIGIQESMGPWDGMGPWTCFLFSSMMQDTMLYCTRVACYQWRTRKPTFSQSSHTQGLGDCPRLCYFYRMFVA